jgi:hypothetical protein
LLLWFAGAGTKVHVYESGASKGGFGSFGPETVLEIWLTPDNKVQYVDDGHVFYALAPGIQSMQFVLFATSGCSVVSVWAPARRQRPVGIVWRVWPRTVLQLGAAAVRCARWIGVSYLCCHCRPALSLEC